MTPIVRGGCADPPITDQRFESGKNSKGGDPPSSFWDSVFHGAFSPIADRRSPITDQRLNLGKLEGVTLRRQVCSHPTTRHPNEKTCNRFWREKRLAGFSGNLEVWNLPQPINKNKNLKLQKIKVFFSFFSPVTF